VLSVLNLQRGRGLVLPATTSTAGFARSGAQLYSNHAACSKNLDCTLVYASQEPVQSFFGRFIAPTCTRGRSITRECLRSIMTSQAHKAFLFAFQLFCVLANETS